MKLIDVKVNEIKGSPFNPTIRTDRRTTKYKSLRASIKRTGMLNPVLLTQDNMLIDGNRRLNIAKELGYKKLHAIVHNSNSDYLFDKYFLETNEHTMPINGHQYLERYLNGASVPTSVRYHIEKLKSVGGVRGLKRILDTGKSPNTFWMAISMFRSYTKRKNLDKKVLSYILNIESPYKIKHYIRDFIPIQTLVYAVDHGEKIQMDYKR